jgi:eukaryotic-like serine/threonine-protein kinase
MLAPGTVLQSRYRIIRQLGQGGMGAVYEALDERLDAIVALKETLFADERLRKQFEREARLLARMHHPALPRVSDHFPEGDGQFLVMQFIAGDDLAEMISRKGGAFPANEVLTWADQLLDALDYLHTQDPQIIHRDIKPQNLKLTARGQIILLDFGLAKGQGSEVSRVTTSASIFGYTPNYAPLEQIQGLGTDARSDIYALGATLYHLMTGVKPPDALTRAAAMVNGQPDPLQRADEVNNAIAPGIAALLERAMAQNREQRYANAVEMRRALQASGETAVVTGRSEAATVLLSPPTPTVSVATRPGVKQATVQHGETTVARPSPPAKKAVPAWVIAIVAIVVLGAGVGVFYAYQQRHSSAGQAVPATPNSENKAASVPSSAAGQVSNTPTTTAAQSEKVEGSNQSATADEKAARKNEKIARDKKAAARRSEATAIPEVPLPRVTHERHAEQDSPPEPEEPDTDLDTPRRGRPRVRSRADGVTIRDFPDGTRVLTTPDGTRVITRPDGSRRVLRPGERINRGRIYP